MSLVLGIDPGKKGGWVIAGDRHDSERMPLTTDGEIDVAFFSELICSNNFDLIVIEKVVVAAQWKKGNGEVFKMGANSSFKFGRDYGMLLGVVRAFHQAHALVAPGSWKTKVLGARNADKADAIRFVTREMPWVDLAPGRCKKAQDGIADAACLAQWGLWKVQMNQPLAANF